MRIGSLFSGAGTLDVAVQAMFGGEIIWHCEPEMIRDKPTSPWRPNPALKVLAKHWPGIPNLGDITKVDWNAMKPNRKLTPDQVTSAVRMYTELEMSLAPIAEYFGVSRQAMWDLLRRRITLRPQKRYGIDNHFWRGGVRADGRAHDIVEKAVLRGALVRPDVCETCDSPGKPYSDGRSPIQAHHCDYNKPLDVMWLCKDCHHDWHTTNTAVPLAGGDANGSLADVDIICGGFP